MKKVAIMQPYFLPYIGYWQLLSIAEEFVVYDNIEFTKKGWFNRNRIIDGDHDRLFTVPIKKGSDYLDVVERFLSDDADTENRRTLRIIQATYKKAPYYSEVFPLLEACFMYNSENLFEYIYHSIQIICRYIGIETKLIISSQVPIDHTLKSEQKVIALCKALDAEMYINSIGGTELYNRKDFSENGLELRFLKPHLKPYEQFGQAFVSGLSIIDILMFNDKTRVQLMLQDYELI